MSKMHSAEQVMSFTMMTFLLAGLVKGVIGMGLPTIAVGLLAKVMAPAQAAALLIIPSFVTNVWQLVAGPSCLSLLRRLWPMMVGIGAGTWAGSGLLSQDAGGRASVTFGATLVAYAILGLTRIKLEVPRAWEPWLSLPIGAVTGVVTTATGVLVIPAVPYLGALGLEKDDLVQALGLSFTVSTMALAGSLFFEGVFHESLAGTSLLALAPALIGMFVGQRLRNRVKPATFRRCFFLGLLGLGVDQLARLVFS
jgi:uncharacterized membrane protein YfcA